MFESPGISKDYDAIVIGAGISGLVVSYRLKRSGLKIALLEDSVRVGGVIETLETGGFLLERGPNSLRGTDKFLELVDELRIREELVTATPDAPAFVYYANKLHAVPMRPLSALSTRLLSTLGKLRVLGEPFIARRSEANDESVASFVRRRLGPEVLDRLVAPFVSGIFAGDEERLSIRACFARLAELESEAGSIARGAYRGFRSKSRSKALAKSHSLRLYRLCSFRSGLQTFPASLAKELSDSLLTGVTISRVARSADASQRFELDCLYQNEKYRLTSRAIVVATPAYVAGSLLTGVAPALADLLGDIRYNSLASVPLGFRVELGRRLNGFGFLVSPSAGLRTLGSIWNSSVFPGRAPAGHVCLTNFVGGTKDPIAVELSDAELVSIVRKDLRQVLGVTGEVIQLPIARYTRAIPQFELGHFERVTQIETELVKRKGLWLAGNYLRGVSIGDCLTTAFAVAEQVERELSAMHT